MPSPQASLPLGPAMRTHLHLDSEVCPWCEQPIPHEKLAEIQDRIETRERERFASLEAGLRQQFAKEKGEAEVKAKREIEAARTAGEAALAALRRDSVKALEEAQSKTEILLARTREDERAAAKTALAGQLAELAAGRDAAEAARAEAEEKLAAQAQGHAEELNARISEVRDALDKEKANALLAEQAKTFEERQKLQSKVQDLQRQLERRTAAELGEGAEIDLYELLRNTFDGDKIRRVPKGTPGADIIHEVMHNDLVAGKIVYDSKNRNAWQTAFATKLRDDMIAAGADHAVLSSNKFPDGGRQLQVFGGVIIACPARVVAVAELLRAHLIQTHTLRASTQQREEKTAALYAFVTSERCSQLFDSIEMLVNGLLDIDVAEQKAHSAVWEKRGKLLRSVLKTHGDICFELDRIIGTASEAA
ncbi:MAG: DUF2130 domain-containing protein [Bauldia sp.]|nr:DUF2130 domain-containing protein [Bauldia sp.]